MPGCGSQVDCLPFAVGRGISHDDVLALLIPPSGGVAKVGALMSEAGPFSCWLAWLH